MYGFIVSISHVLDLWNRMSSPELIYDKSKDESIISDMIHITLSFVNQNICPYMLGEVI